MVDSDIKQDVAFSHEEVVICLSASLAAVVCLPPAGMVCPPVVEVCVSAAVAVCLPASAVTLHYSADTVD